MTARTWRREQTRDTVPGAFTGLAQHGYRAVCVGGVTCFSRETPLGRVLPGMFREDRRRPGFRSPEPDSTHHRADHASTVAEQYAGRPLFLFVFLFVSVSAPTPSRPWHRSPHRARRAVRYPAVGAGGDAPES
ncbi:hypothetical protein ACFVH9_10240 [Streptomyces hirsutus]|uniref:hypothetical protein n=1 Tax=Streptomyces hirsutus TaxID=35620 RepID=UPI003638F0B9